MTTEISGTVEDETGASIDGATVYVVRESDDTIVATTTTDSTGGYQVTGLSDTETYHVGAQWDDGSTKYAGESYPFVEPFTDTGPIDDFEDNDITEYTGNKTSFNVQSNVVQEGSFALEMGNDDNSFHLIHSSSGLPRYPSQGDAFSFRCYTHTSGIAEMLFGFQDTDNHYRVRISARNGGVKIQKEDGGFLTDLASTAVTIPTGEWLEGVIQWGGSGDIEFTLNDSSGTEVASVGPVNDTIFTSGGIGWRAVTEDFTGDSVFFDIAQLDSVSGATPGATSGIDNFEDGDIDEYAGDTGNYEANSNSPVQAGTFSLKHTATSTSRIYSSTGLPDYPELGDTFEGWIYLDDSDDSGMFAWSGSDADNAYWIQVNKNISEFRAFSRESGGFNTLATTSISIGTGWFRGEVTWNYYGRLTCTLYDSGGNQQAQIEFGDASYISSTGWGWRTNADTVAFDEAFVTGEQSDPGTGTIDDFSDGDIAEYNENTGDFTVNSGTLVSSTDSTRTKRIGAQTGIERPVRQGQTLTLDIRFTDDADGFPQNGFFIFALEDETDITNNGMYRADVRPDGSGAPEFRLIKRDTGGGGSTLASDTNLTIPYDEWLSVEIQWANDGSITATLDDSGGNQISQISGVDTEHKYGGIGWGFVYKGDSISTTKEYVRYDNGSSI
jgi:hypothetical protein